MGLGVWWIDIHGVPGTGKTATVHSVVRELQNDPVRSSPFPSLPSRRSPSFPSSLFSPLPARPPASADPPPRAQDIDSFQFVEINGMKIAEPNTAFSLLWEAVSGGQKAAPRVALTQLEGHFGTPSPARKTTCVRVPLLSLVAALPRVQAR